MKTIFNIVYYATIGAVGLVGLLLVATLIPIPGNFEVKVVKSGSMEPAIRVGSVVVIKPATSYGIGDIVTFGADTKTQIPTTHRIIATEGEGSGMTFQTKGDANDTPDNTVVSLSDIHGKEILTLPYLGYLLAFARTQWGFVVLVGFPALLIFLEEGRNIFKEIRRIRGKRRGPPMNTPPTRSLEIKPPVQLARVHVVEKKTVRMMGVLGAVILMPLIAGFVLRGGGETAAYYKDTTASVGNTLGAAKEFPTLLPPVTLSAVSLLGDIPPAEEDAPPADVPTDVPPADTPADVPQDEPVPEVILGETQVVDVPPAEVPPAEAQPPEQAPPAETPAE